MSWWADLPVAPLVGERLWHSAWLFAWASLITVPIALGLALGTVIRRGGLFDRGTSLASVVLISIPDFVIAYGLIIVLALKFDLFPTYTLFALDMSLVGRTTACQRAADHVACCRHHHADVPLVARGADQCL
jgi:peptide/nickel transport system permease protein